jgi:hypothetical protein
MRKDRPVSDPNESDRIRVRSNPKLSDPIRPQTGLSDPISIHIWIEIRPKNGHPIRTGRMNIGSDKSGHVSNPSHSDRIDFHQNLFRSAPFGSDELEIRSAWSDRVIRGFTRFPTRYYAKHCARIIFCINIMPRPLITID